MAYLLIDFQEIWDFLGRKKGTPYIPQTLDSLADVAGVVMDTLVGLAENGIRQRFMVMVPKSRKEDYPFEYQTAPMSHPERNPSYRPSLPAHWKLRYKPDGAVSFVNLIGGLSPRTAGSARQKTTRVPTYKASLDLWWVPISEAAEKIMSYITDVGHDGKSTRVAGVHTITAVNKPLLVFPRDKPWRSPGEKNLKHTPRVDKHPGVRDVYLANGVKIRARDWLQRTRAALPYIYEKQLTKVTSSLQAEVPGE